MENKKLRHSKYKNTALIFELLVRQSTSDIMSNSSDSTAIKIIEKYFKPNKYLLGKELKFYKLMMESRYTSLDKAKDLVSGVLEERKKINNIKLRKEKYNLIKEIKDNYDIDGFFSSKVPNYKVLASIYMLFESVSGSSGEMSPDKRVDCKHTVLEHILDNKKIIDKKEVINESIEEFMKLNDDLRKLSYKVMLDKFNDKYKSLDSRQKNLLREYIYTQNIVAFRDFVNSEIDYVKEILDKMSPKIGDKTTRIKVEGIVDYIDRLKKGKSVKDEQLVSLMTYYELIKEIKKIIKCSNLEKING